MGLRLVPLNIGKTIKLDKPVLLCGRNPDCDVVLVESQKVSRLHCIVACVNNRVFVRDLGSTNGLWVNGQRVERESRVRIGDEVSVADIAFELVNGDESPAPREERQSRKPSRQERAAKREVEPDLPDRDDDIPQRRLVNRIAPGQDKLVAIPDEDDSFVVEPSVMRMSAASSDSDGPLPLARLLEEDDDEPPVKRDRKPKRPAKDVPTPRKDDDRPLPNRGDSEDEIRLDFEDE